MAQLSIDAIESALVYGDLAKLDPAGRIQYYNQVCKSLGLNPLTKPFAYITLNGKLQLYALKDCTEQLRTIHNISVTKLEKERIEDVYVVTAYVRNAAGREDSSTGAVSAVYPDQFKDKDGNWRTHPKTGKPMQGDDLANALMKAETKSKRRATLSICGLGILEESELETIHDAKPFREVEELPAPKPEPVKPLINRQLEASLAIEEPKPESKVDDIFTVSGDRITCIPVDVIEKKAKNGSPCMLVKLNGAVDSFEAAFCYSAHLFPALRESKDKMLVFTAETRKNFLHVADVLRVGDQEYVNGLPVGEQREPQLIDSIPF